jgi:hypothetical protein
VNLTIEYQGEEIQEEYDHPFLVKVYSNGNYVGESSVKKSSSENSVTISLPKGLHAIEAVGYCQYKGKWEKSIQANDYSVDSKFSENFDLQENTRITIIFNMQKGPRLVSTSSYSVRNLAPKIRITPPGKSFNVGHKKAIRISGIAEDTDGIHSVKVNEIEANLKSDGYFSATVPLSSGKNKITVIATDKRMASSVRSFIINEKDKTTPPVITRSEKRVALVFGNSNYSGPANLNSNPINDANDIAATLQTLGFKVIVKTDATLSVMNNAIREFGRKNKDADIALFFFAGHGMQIENENYLVPIGVDIRDKNDVSFECISVNTVQKLMETSSSNRLNLIILDACRDNPYRSWQRGGESGLADMSPPSGTLIAFATSPGKTASNGDGENGLYTGELVKQLIIPQRIEDVFINTRVAVEKKSEGKQSPWELARLRGQYFLQKQ